MGGQGKARRERIGVGGERNGVGRGRGGKTEGRGGEGKGSTGTRGWQGYRIGVGAGNRIEKG